MTLGSSTVRPASLATRTRIGLLAGSAGATLFLALLLGCSSGGQDMTGPGGGGGTPGEDPCAEGPAIDCQEDCDNFELCYVDGDGDTFGNDGGNTTPSLDFTCTAGGLSTTADDCDDIDPAVNPNAVEGIADHGTNSATERNQ